MHSLNWGPEVTVTEYIIVRLIYNRMLMYVVIVIAFSILDMNQVPLLALDYVVRSAGRITFLCG